MNDLTFENTDKVFPAIQYNDGWVWVGENEVQNTGYVLFNKVWGVPQSDGGRIIKVVSRYMKSPKHSREYVLEGNSTVNISDCTGGIIAQTPDLDLEGVPVVEVDKTPQQILREVETRCNATIFDEAFKVCVIAMKEYAAQSKGSYTEEQVREAIEMARKEDFNTFTRETIERFTDEQILQSIRPKIVVMTTCINNGDRLNCANETCWDLNECQHSPVKPITEIKNGRTYFKIL